MVLDNHTIAKDVLPTRSGPFFGGTDYDEYYFDDVKIVREELFELWKGFDSDRDVVYVIMSW